VWRAVTQSIVYDEAVTYIWFVRDSFADSFAHYNANNHALFSALAKLTTSAFGTSEFTLRLPTVAAGIGYLVVVHAVARRLCGSGALFLLTAAALALNPLVFDFLSAARGYGLALFFFMFALYELGRERPRWTVASLALGACVCANLAFLFPATGLALVASALALVPRLPNNGPRSSAAGPPSPALGPRPTVLGLTCRFWIPGAVFTAAILVVPLSHAERADFWFGAATLRETAWSLVTMSLAHHPTAWTVTWGAGFVQRMLAWTIPIVIGLSFLAPFGEARCGSISRWSALVGGTWAATLVPLACVHVLFDVAYPMERTGLYFIPLYVLTVAVLAHASPRLATRVAAGAILAVLVATSLEQFTVKSYATWQFDAGSRDIAETIASWPGADTHPVTVAASEWLYAPALEFYRIVRFPNRIASVNDGYVPAEANRFDFLVLTEQDTAGVDPAWRRVLVHRVSGAHLLVNPRVGSQ